MLHRFAGLDDSVPEQPKEMPPPTEGILVLAPQPNRLIITQVDLDAVVLAKLGELLEEAKKYRRPPQELLEIIADTYAQLCEPHMPLAQRIMRTLFG